MKLKKILASLMVGTMMLSLVACGSEKPSVQETSSSQKEASSQETTKSQQEEKEEIVTLKCYMLGNPATESQLSAVVEAMNEITREEIGAELDWTIIDGGSMSEKMNVIMASGEAFDICFTGYCNNYANAVSNGGLYDITELLAECPGILETVPDYALDQCYIDGKLYGIPNMQILASYISMVCRKDLVEKYNFDYESVETLEDFEPFFEQVHANEEGVYATGYDGGALYYMPYRDKYVDVAGVLALKKDGSGELVSRLDVPEYVAALEVAAEWYNKGYIRKDALTVENVEAERKAGKYASWLRVGKPGTEAEVYNNYGIEVVEVPITKPSLGSPVSTMLSVGANSENPLKALQLIELLNTNEELHNLAVYGIEGIHYNLNAEGKVELIENSGYNQSGFTWALGNQFITKLMYNQQDDLWEVTQELNDSAELPYNYGFSIPSEIKDEYATESANINAVWGEYEDIMTFGIKYPDEYINELKDRIADSQAVIKEKIQPVVDEFIAGK